MTKPKEGVYVARANEYKYGKDLWYWKAVRGELSSFGTHADPAAAAANCAAALRFLREQDG